jgi:hypothetical protein
MDTMIRPFVITGKWIVVEAAGMLRTAGVGSAAFVGLIMAVLVLVIGISLTGTVVTEADSALTTAASSGNFGLVEVILPFVPVVYVAAIMGLAGGIGFVSLRGR